MCTPVHTVRTVCTPVHTVRTVCTVCTPVHTVRTVCTPVHTGANRQYVVFRSSTGVGLGVGVGRRYGGVHISTAYFTLQARYEPLGIICSMPAHTTIRYHLLNASSHYH